MKPCKAFWQGAAKKCSMFQGEVQIMSYYNKTELSFAEGYYHIHHGIVSFDDDTPTEIIERFWKLWPEFREKVIERQKKGLLDSRYPILPWDDPQENKMHYEK